MADLLTLAEYKALLGINPTLTTYDTQITALLPAASRAVRAYTDRRFDIAAGPTARMFQYDGSGYIEMDDFTSIVSIQTDGGYTGGPVYTLDAIEYTAMPYRETTDDDPHYYIILHSFPGSYSPEMGFKNNLDTLDIFQRPIILTVTATWGWTAIPTDVKLAAAWTIQNFISKPPAGDLQAESIESYSRRWATAGSMLAVPNQARDLLVNYARPF